MPGRLLELTLRDPYENLAFEEALLRAAEVPTLRVWGNQTSVVIGRAQLARFETDIGYCAAHSIPVVRRFTAGGAVYHGLGELNWTFVIPVEEAPSWLTRVSGAKGVFESFARVVVEALRDCGVVCSFDPPNSIVGARGKISGMAAYVSKESILCHGTLLVGADLEEVQKLTRPKEDRLERRYPRSKPRAVANCGVRRSDLVSQLSAREPGFRRGSVTKAEAELCAGLLGKYRSAEWNFGDPFELDYL